ncbi:MAG: hypothetical protein MUC38_07390 [Cyclobacteriaceae bacterium]|nr:hypothetical protein [Cyclobacteriaceae bacterium]
MKKKECPSCAMDIDSACRECPICGYAFTEQTPWIRWTAVFLLIVLLLLYLLQ